jgi:translation initiation factor 4E
MYYVPKTQDESNVRGGKWIVRLRKNLVSRYWENLVCGRDRKEIH